eukprot:TRINITY_DN7641_c0_g1_i1.p2 TRINITY_DN7641_c0_g1~~TRINITY_DN7641_c0_g1_i1.p2  ORF type:complete len:394 (+),score=128.37 TRINITY_DN7641_c0_g1_i1:68-1183(+)
MGGGAAGGGPPLPSEHSAEGGPAGCPDPRGGCSDEESGDEGDALLGSGSGAERCAPRALLAACRAGCCRRWNEREGEWAPAAAASSPAQRYALLGGWIAALGAAWILSKLCCLGGLPADCDTGWRTGGTSEDLGALAVWGAALGWLTGVTDLRRARRLWRWWVVLTFFATPPVFAALSLVPGTDHGVTSSGSSWSAEWIALTAALAALVCALLAWHLAYARRQLGRPEFRTYVASRAAVTTLTALRVLVALPGNTQHVQMHLHHYVLAWSGAVWCSFAHPLSRFIFAVLCGIFVQGLGAYSYDGIFDEKDNCAHWDHYAAMNYTAAAAAAPFRLKLCIVTPSGGPGGRTPPGMAVSQCPGCGWAPWPHTGF